MISAADFRSAWWLPGGHLQTLWGTLCRRQRPLALRRERLELADGDFLDLDWTLRRTGPLVLIFHGLEGSSLSHYAQGLLAALDYHGWRAVVAHFRGCSGEPNRQARSYCAGETADMATVVTTLHAREPATPIACVGYSLGGNALLKWLGEQGANAPVQAAVAVSVPFLLDTSARRMSRGFSRLYQGYLLRKLKRSCRRKQALLHAALGLSATELEQLNDFFAFDDRITAPLHGYNDVHDYYARASCRPYLRQIQHPTLILHARNDPFMLPSAIPIAAELAEPVRLELSHDGGHVGFIGGAVPGRPVYWLEQRIPAFFAPYLDQATA